MTVEATTKTQERYGLLGIRTREVEKTSVVEYRHAELSFANGSISESRRPFGIDYGPRDEHGHIQLYTPKTWAWVTGEDEVRVKKATPLPSGDQRVHEFHIYKRREINAANLTTENGKITLNWRPTEENDYPEAVLFETNDAEVIVFFEEPRIRVEAA